MPSATNRARALLAAMQFQPDRLAENSAYFDVPALDGAAVLAAIKTVAPRDSTRRHDAAWVARLVRDAEAILDGKRVKAADRLGWVIQHRAAGAHCSKASKRRYPQPDTATMVTLLRTATDWRLVRVEKTVVFPRQGERDVLHAAWQRPRPSPAPAPVAATPAGPETPVQARRRRNCAADSKRRADGLRMPWEVTTKLEHLASPEAFAAWRLEQQAAFRAELGRAA